MNPHADRDRSEEPTRYGCRCTIPCATAHDCAQTPQAVFVDLSSDDLFFPGRWITDAELAEKDATIARLEAEVEQWRTDWLRLDREASASVQKAEAALARVEALCDVEDARVAEANQRYAERGDLVLKTGRPIKVVGILPVRTIRKALRGDS